MSRFLGGSPARPSAARGQNGNPAGIRMGCQTQILVPGIKRNSLTLLPAELEVHSQQHVLRTMLRQEFVIYASQGFELQAPTASLLFLSVFLTMSTAAGVQHYHFVKTLPVFSLVSSTLL